jgi:hypothetical protein
LNRPSTSSNPAQVVIGLKANSGTKVPTIVRGVG